MTYNLTLANIVPAASAFSVLVNSGARSVSTVAISGTKVQLTLPRAIKYGDIVSVVYTKPSTNPLQSSAGGLAISFSSAQSVTNSVINSTKDGTPVAITMTVSPNHVHKIINAL
jgi:ribosomal protein L14